MEHLAWIGNPEALFNSKVSTMVVQRALPDVVGFLIGKRGPQQAEQDLRDISRIITQRMLLVWQPKSKKPYQIVKEMMGLFFGNKKVKGKVIERNPKDKRPTKIIIRDRDCPICPEKKGEELEEVTEIHYCVAVAGFIEAVIRHLMDSDLVPYTNVVCKTVKSVGSGDKHCEHHIDLEYGGW